jgi:mannose-6-phosphate isomerase-like protein (cupin superfamily)
MTHHPAAHPQFLRDGAGDVLQFSPSERLILIWKATAATTAGAFDRFELTADPDHAGAPEHAHDNVDEAFFVLDGAFQFKLGDEVLVAEAGTYWYVFVPRGINHTWRNAALRRSRMILTYVPGGMQSFFEESAPLMHAATPDLAAPEKVNERHATHIVGPPLPSPSPPAVQSTVN